MRKTKKKKMRKFERLRLIILDFFSNREKIDLRTRREEGGFEGLGEERRRRKMCYFYHSFASFL